MNNDFLLGQYVKSKAGRDKDRIFIVIDIVDDKYVLIADGDLRKIENPKKKKIMHLNKIKTVSEDIKIKIETDKKVTNLMLRMEIEKFGFNKI